MFDWKRIEAQQGIGSRLGVNPLLASALSSAGQITDTHKVINGVTKQAMYWHFPPSNDDGLYNYLLNLTASPDQLKSQIPGFDPATAKPFVFAPSRNGQPWRAHYMFAFGNNNGSLLSSGQFYTKDLDFGTAQKQGVAFGIDVPNSKGGFDRYWFQGPDQNASLQVEN
jgi:hypothetical protein